MKKTTRNKIWVAVRVERGFPVEVKAFSKKTNAERQELAWRKTMNPDYDETGVLALKRFSVPN